MNRENLLHLYDKLTALVSKLPGGLQKPILQELVPIRQLFLEQRPARLLLLGDPQPEVEAFLRGLFVPTTAGQAAAQGEVAANGATAAEAHVSAEERTGVKPEVALASDWVDNGWRSWRVGQRGEVLVFDARGADVSEELWQQALGRYSPDVAVLFQGAEGMDAASGWQRALARLTAIPSPVPQAGISSTAAGGAEGGGVPAPLPLVALFTGAEQEAGVERLRALLHARKELSGRVLRVLSAAQTAAVAEAICAFLPHQAKMEFALLGDIRPAQVEIARSLLKSFTAVCGVIGMQPIPLADLPILTTLQSLMVGLIAYVSGRRLGPKTLTEFFGAVGVSFGLGMLFREGARAIIKVVPGFGHAVSGMVAGAGTYAIGRAAIAYFIERVPARETRQLFQKIKPRKTSFLRRSTPPPKLPPS